MQKRRVAVRATAAAALGPPEIASLAARAKAAGSASEEA